MSGPEIISKITRADLGVTIPRLDGPDGKPMHVFDLAGRVRGSKVMKGKGDKESIQFLGEFQAKLANGKVFYAGRAHVPSMFEEVLYSQLATAQAADPKATVEFLIRVGAKPPKPGKPSAVGYEWTVEPLVDIADSNPLEALFERAKDRLAISAPDTAKVADIKHAKK